MCVSDVRTGSNDGLVDYLINFGYIKSPSVEKYFRLVDRGEYIWPPRSPEFDLYRTNHSWTSGNFQISGPCVYGVVMEELGLKPGMSFLNLGSGTGYLSTLAGLALGHTGVNHGIEQHEDVVQFSREKVKDFMRFSGAVDECDFCEPKFTQGNFLNIPGNCHRYNRVYCGALCSFEQLDFLAKLVEVGGILIAPVSPSCPRHEGTFLFRMIRVSEDTWVHNWLLDVDIRSATEPDASGIILPDIKPPTLLELSRTKIRQVIRASIETDYPEISGHKWRSRNLNQRSDFYENLLLEHTLNLHLEDVPLPRPLDGNRDRSGERPPLVEEHENDADHGREEVGDGVGEAAREQLLVERKMYKSPYTKHMRARIRQLQLPLTLKRYLLFAL